MPKSGKKGLKKNSYLNYSCLDIKLEDFANSHVSSVRRKPTVNSLAREVKTLCTLERSWFETDTSTAASFINSPGDVELEEELDKERHSALKIKKQEKNSMQGNCQKGKYDTTSEKTYPLDLWFLISNYVKPEDVGTFAAVCKASYFVSQTYSFWINLYRRHYRAGSQLPLQLQPHSIRRPRGLKASVIRSLYYFYPRFSEFINCTSLHSKDVYRLKKHVCVSMWHSHVHNKWVFFFKFHCNMLKSRTNVDLEARSQRDVCHWDAYEYEDQHDLISDVNVNPEEGCSILKITTPHFVAFPIVMGARLADIKFSLTCDLSKQKLQLVFSFSNYRQACRNLPQLVSRQCGGTGEILEFDPVDSALVLDWWHPQYPSSNTFAFHPLS